MRGLVSEEVLGWIVKVPLNFINRKDEPVWKVARNGKYEVKKGYYATKNMNTKVVDRASSSTVLSGELWKKVWRIKALPKIIHFIWRCLVRALPVREELARRKCRVPVNCPICNKEVETIEHALFTYPWAKSVWFGSELALRFEKASFGNLGSWCMQVLVEEKFLDDFQLAYVAWLMWLIWKERNNAVFEFKAVNLVKVINEASKAVREFWEAKGWTRWWKGKMRM
ncbi:uncharacterized protein LOC114748364 [Neltuma alba]|uniref:uncharacterized protein LOC114748364 n=1 Tax=Neltuma alba TaxID=207710 RepID=UPI0010A3AE17|nr:uncharacterized protein LOC114748364 [Prosopis alba]